jgi:hypothetical protein
MAAPYPPQGNQTSHTERPLKVYAEQYLEGGPLPVGVVVDVVPPVYANGEPRVYATTGTYPIRSTDWVITNRYTGAPIEVISDEEFTERFGPGGPPLAEGG